jgi:hypothetical protein
MIDFWDNYIINNILQVANQSTDKMGCTESKATVIKPSDGKVPSPDKVRTCAEFTVEPHSWQLLMKKKCLGAKPSKSSAAKR